MTPLLQVSNMIFRGTHEVLVGTELLFTDGRGKRIKFAVLAADGSVLR